MRHVFGMNDYFLRKEGKEMRVTYSPEELTSPHVSLIGSSGTGKSWQIRRMLESAAKAGIEIDIFDPHEELHDIPGAVAVKYSQATGYGYNPLVLDLDPHTGGVNRQADFIVSLIKQVSTQFGSKQEATLRNLIICCYEARGIYADNPRSWQRKQITESQRAQLMRDRKWDELREYYPTLSDLLSFAEKKVMAMLFGGDNKAMSALESATKANTALQRLAVKANKVGISAEEKAKLEGQVEQATKRAIDAYSEAIMAKPTREVRDLVLFDSLEVVTGVVQRLQLLTASGIFSASAPPFGNAKVRVHQIKALSDEQQLLFVKLRLRAIFDEAKSKGPTESGYEVRHIALLDEASRFFNDDSNDIINIIGREARKFGLGLWACGQQPNFPESFIVNCGAKIITGLDSSYWRMATTKLRASEDTLKFIKPTEVMAVKLHRRGQSDPPFVNVIVPNPRTDQGRKALAMVA